MMVQNKRVLPSLTLVLLLLSTITPEVATTASSFNQHERITSKGTRPESCDLLRVVNTNPKAVTKANA